jgi:uncharacterized protein YegL
MVYLETMAQNAGMVYKQPVHNPNYPTANLPVRPPIPQKINVMPIKNAAGSVSYLGLCNQCGLADPMARLDVYDGFFYCTCCWQVYEENAPRWTPNEWFHRQLVEANVFEVRGPDVSNYVEKFKSNTRPKKGVSFAHDVKKEDGRGDTWAVCAEVDEDIQRHIVLVLDMSGSMRMEDVIVFDRFVSRAEAVRLAALEFLAAQDDKIATYSAVTFNSEATVICRRAQRDDVYETVRHARFAAFRTTEYTKGLGSALELADEGDNLEIVLISDGRPGDAHKALSSLQGELAKKRTRVHAIGLDPSATQYLQQLAAISGGSYVESARSLTSMRNAFTTVSTAIATNHGVSSEQVLKDVQFEVPNAHTGETVKCSRSWFYFDGTDFTEHKVEDREVSVREKPFTQCGMRLVHGLQDATLPQVKAHRMVAKYSKYIDNDTPEFTLYASKSVAVAKFFVRCFEHAATPEMMRTVKFIVLECYRYIEEESKKSFVGERYLPGAFTKFNSNNGYVDSEHPLTEMVQALSHFSYQASEGEYLVADLQGVVAGSENRCFCFFTDPQVLSVRKEFGPADLGAAGMRKFFARHRCGKTCEALGLCGHCNGKDDFEVVPSELGCGSSVLSQLLSDEEEEEDEEEGEDLGGCEQAANIAEDLAAAVLEPAGCEPVLPRSLEVKPRGLTGSTHSGSESASEDEWAVL